MFRALVVLAAAATAAVAAQAAGASQLIDRNASGVSLAVNTKGEALISYRAHGSTRHVLAWGAVNAIAPTRTRAQVAFKLDYAGGWGKYHTKYWATFHNACRPYSGPKLSWFVSGCTAPDGSFWALQAWQRMLPDYGLAPSPAQSVWELRLSHWTGPLAVLDISVGWAYRKFDKLFGAFTYDGEPVYGFRATSAGAPLDSFGRNIYVDTYDSAYGSGWKRDNSFLTHTGHGTFCYGFYPHGSHPAGNGTKYRATAEGPGVTPDVMWQADAPGAFDVQLQAQSNQALAALGDPLCRPN